MTESEIWVVLLLSPFVVTIVWVIFDAVKLQVYKYEGYCGIFTLAIGCVLAWIVCFPWYWYARRGILNGTSGLRLKFVKSPPPFFKDRRNDLLARIPRKTVSDSTRMEFLSLWIGRAGNLFSALKRDGLSTEACQIILKTFRRLGSHYNESGIRVMCYLTYHPPKIDDNAERLLNRLELLVKARHHGKIDVHTYKKMVLQIEKAIYTIIPEKDNLPKRLRLNPEKPMIEAASALAAIAMGAPQGWARNKHENTENPVQRPDDECKPQPNPIVYSGKIMNRSVFEDMLYEIESEWDISFTGENDIRSDFVDESDKNAAYLDVDILSDRVFSVLKRMEKMPPEHSKEWYDERDREGYRRRFEERFHEILSAYFV